MLLSLEVALNTTCAPVELLAGELAEVLVTAPSPTKLLS